MIKNRENQINYFYNVWGGNNVIEEKEKDLNNMEKISFKYYYHKD